MTFATVPIYDSISLNTTSSPSPFQGAVHLAGKNYGTIHTAPHSNERLVVIVIPEKPELIEKHHKAIKERSASKSYTLQASHTP